MSTKYAVQPTPMRLFSSSLETHMEAYTEEIKLNQLNQEYQLAQNRIIREGELYNLSQADLMNRLNALKEQLLNSIKPPVVKKVESKEEEKKFIKPSIKIPSRKSSPLQKEIEEKKASLKKTPLPEKKIKVESKFEQELKEKAKKISPSSTGATTASESESIGVMPRNPTFNETKKDFIIYLKKHNIQDVKITEPRFSGIGAQSEINKEYSRLLDIYGEGLKNKKKVKKNK